MNATNTRPQANPPSATAPSLSLEVWGGTHPGRVRPQNEDMVWPDGPGRPLPDGSYLLLVADGVGGAQAGATASRMVTDEIVRYCQSVPLVNPGQALAQAVQAANTAVYNYVSGSPTVSQAASTVTAALVKDGRAHVANVGDSRTYLIRHGSARQLTRDHTLTQQKIDSGRISPAQAELDEERSVITRSLGSASNVQVDLFPPLPLQPGDMLLLCSDGLTDMLSEADMARITGRKRPQAAVERLIAEANRRGGHDNTAVVVGRAPGRPIGTGGNWPLALFLAGGLLLVAAILLVVGGLLLGQPSATATALITPTSVAAVALATPLPAQATPMVPASPTVPNIAAPATPGIAPTSTPLPTYTPPPISTLAGPPPAPPPAGQPPTTLPGQPTRAPLPPASVPLAVPVLQDPPEGASALQGIGATFKWGWRGELAEGWGFEVRIWQEGDPDHFGAFDARELTQYLAHQPDGIYAVTLLVEGAYSVHLHGGGDYYWTVAVVQLEPYARIGPEALPRKLRFVIPTRPGPSEKPGGGKGEEPSPPPEKAQGDNR
jgi:serine/threonine protein phosphatase PrpC